MDVFQTNSSIVLKYLSENNASPTVCCLSHSCLSKLGKFLHDTSISYSLDVAKEWLSQLSLCANTIQTYGKAIRQLDDVYKYGHVSFANRIHSMILSGQFSGAVSDYLSDISGKYSKKHLPNIRIRCKYFLEYMQVEHQHSEICEITYTDVLSFHGTALKRLSKADYGMYKGTIANFLRWLSEKEACPIGFSMLLFMNHAEKVFMLRDFSNGTALYISAVGASCLMDFSPEEFYTASLDFCMELESLGYADTMKTTARTALDLLYLFLDMNRLGYDPKLVNEWFHEKGDFCFKKNKYMARRIFALFEVFTKEGTIITTCYFTYRPLLCDGLPDWCKRTLDQFLLQKERENLAASTVCMYRSSITRFCFFIVDNGISSFNEITPELLKRFNISDIHSTPEGKNAYNVRIRKFLFYLADNCYTDNYFLGNALPCVHAPSTKIVKTLTPDESYALENYMDEDYSLGLRNQAIALIGLKMGLRGSDITELTFEQIDWRLGAIRFIQKKTSVERVLPMPVEVGNALYRYITEGRPDSKSKYVFIVHKAPYGRVKRNICRRIIQKVFPEGRDDGYGFHITRKTYATERFRNHVGYTEVAYLIGHTTDETVKKYISLDEERMRLCPISLSESGITMKGGFRNA